MIYYLYCFYDRVNNSAVTGCKASPDAEWILIIYEIMGFLRCR